MISRNNSYYAKLLLFGEYSILLGSSALSIPYSQFSAEFSFIHDVENTNLKQAVESRQHLLELLIYLKKSGNYSEILDLHSFQTDLNKGIYLKSTIPNSYGLGSSGAVVVAVYSRYAITKSSAKKLNMAEMENLCKVFSNMESFFHGTSSGIDPLSIFINQPLLISKGRKPSIVEMPRNTGNNNVSIFLIDSGEAGKTKQLVGFFLNMFATDEKMNREAKTLVELTDQCIQYLLNGNINNFSQSLLALSAFQLSTMHTLIPEKMKKVWKDGLESKSLVMKLCGSGGGGYLIAFAHNHSNALQFLNKNNLSYVTVNIPIS